eukprot:TRINITY_DN856_c0_g1_i2.p1 TRINITY_DN856_c0_g1~~TRINITY_DN856_c0_g1_i2.p1  ORF type:complete len:103 (+),score=9.23 TRINITY_DN856_c0_g1_i2:719-1027(+)
MTLTPTVLSGERLPESPTIRQGDDSTGKILRPIPVFPAQTGSMVSDLNQPIQKSVIGPSPLSLKMPDQEPPPSRQSSAFQAMPGFGSGSDLDSKGGSIITVA